MNAMKPSRNAIDDDIALTAALAPRSVVVIGASDDPNKIGGRPIHYMLRNAYAGRIFPINPNRPLIQGLQAFRSLDDIDEVPDLAIIAVAGDAAVAAVEACAARGVRIAVVIASGFGETGEAGRAVQQRMVDVARSAGMRIVGPNTQGIANFGNGAIANFSTLFSELPARDGPVAICSQSGGMSQMVYGLVRARGVGVRHVHATGNEADLTVADFALACVHDPEVRLLLLYLESIADPEKLARAAAAARARGVPIVALKAGRTPAGQRAASSHTGALANEDRVVDAFFLRHGIWRARDPYTLALAADAYLQDWTPAGRRLVVISNSGASCVLAADEAQALDLPLATLAPETRAEIASRLPGFATSTNPIDVTAALLQNSRLFGDVLPVIAGDAAADLFFIDLPVAGAGYDVAAFARDTAAFAKATGKPVVVAAAQPSIAAVFQAAGVLAYPDAVDALGVLAQLCGHAERLRNAPAPWPGAAELALPASSDRFLDEAQSLSVLQARGLPVVAHRLCRSAADVLAACRELTGRLAVKACSPDLPHKSEHGLVQLGIEGEQAATDAFQTISAQVERLSARSSGVLVARMIDGGREFMVGARIDAVFGPVVVVGAGGRDVEALADVATLLPPFDAAEVEAALRGLHIGRLLDGGRGRGPLDVRALVDIVIRTGRLICDADGAIASIDLNPVIVGEADSGAWIVDALIERGPASPPQAPA
jgi:acyl-CoA synthetase (NDP forming)